MWATHPKVVIRIKAIVEHYAHHKAASKYQKLVSKPVSVSNDCSAWMANENMPTDIMNAKLLLSETEIQATWKDLRLIGRVDQAYVTQSNRVTLVDSKAHSTVTFRDQLQLSFYAYILLKNGYRIDEVSYIRSFAYDDIEYQEVDIIPAQTFIEILGLIE
ncbi:hypothetical protein VHA01S_030_00410 [Vibrio halioticoli NBRC 102217]|uniref:PD-(D/E)XK endonuclease-like domain-containing protein n=2 Tax=Vibrio halioticoli TaxID=71388 RepID=V5FJN7_9VIBR|nr:hypothetical protein VHA01S_030_00410 [Vibrio halioticoli NBRC 102217]